MRKILLVMLIFILAVTSGFAAKTPITNKYYKRTRTFNNEVSVLFTPYALQRVERTNMDKTKVNSEYGIGAKLRYTGWKNNSYFYFGGDCSYFTATERQMEKDYSNFLFLGKSGLQLRVADSIRWGLGLEAGMDVTTFESNSSLAGVFGLELFGDFRVAKNFSAIFTIDGLMAFSSKNGADYRHMFLTTNVGMGYTF